MSKTIEASVSYTIPDDFENAGDEVSGSFQYIVIKSVEDAVNEIGENEVMKLLQKGIKIQSANKARVKLMSDNKHVSYKALSEEAKAKLKATRKHNQDVLKKLHGLDPSELAKLGIEL